MMRWILTMAVTVGLVAGCGGGGGKKPEVRLSRGGTATAPTSVMAQQSESGKASWYGDKFHGRSTASGEKYDMNAISAAHKSHRFGTKVRVTNVETGESLVVRINDRMPDTSGNKGRVIDLSKAAFKKLAPLERGIIDVRLEVVQ